MANESYKYHQTIKVIFVNCSILFLSYSLFDKILNYYDLKYSIANVGTFNEIEVELIAIITVLLESVTLILLIFNYTKGLVMLFMVFTVFTSYIIYLKIINKYLICGCGGFLNGLSFNSHLLINMVILIVSLYFILKRQ